MAATFFRRNDLDDDDEFQIWSNPKNNTGIVSKLQEMKKMQHAKRVNEIIDVYMKFS